MKKTIIAVVAVVLCLFCTACVPAREVAPSAELKISQVKNICELAVMECFYHNVAKFEQEDAQGTLWWTKDKEFWIEYSGVVKLGIDVSRVEMVVEGDTVTITMPEAEIQSCQVDSSSLTEDSYIVAADSADIDAEDEILAFEEAQRRMEETASQDKTLLAEAQQRAKMLLEDYVTNIGKAAGKEYIVRWVDAGSENSPVSSTQPDTQT